MGIFSGILKGSGSISLPAAPIDEQQKIDQAHTKLQTAYADLKKQLQIPELTTICSKADKIKVKIASTIKGIGAVERGHSFKDLDTNVPRLESLISKFILDANLNIGGSTDTFKNSLTNLVKATLAHQKSDPDSDPQIKDSKIELAADIKKFLETDAGKPLIDLADNYRIARLDHQIAQGHAIRIEPNPESSENRLKFAASLVYRIIMHDQERER